MRWLAGVLVGCLIWPASALGALPVSSSSRIVSLLGQERAFEGVPGVRESKALSAGCAAHDQYLTDNGPFYLLHQSGHFEDPHRPGYTKAGDHAARTSVLAWGTNDSWALNGDPWDGAAFHIFQLLNPAVQVVGADERTMSLGNGQTVNLECVDTFAGPFRAGPRKLRVYLVPRPGRTLPALTLNEEPESVLGTPSGQFGPPVFFAYFLGRGVKRVKVRSLRVSINGKPVKVAADYVGGASGPKRASADAAGAGSLSGIGSSTSFFFSPEPGLVFDIRDASRPPSDVPMEASGSTAGYGGPSSFAGLEDAPFSAQYVIGP